MVERSSLEQREHELTVHVFSISAAMIGVCLTAIGILRLVSSESRTETLGDELLAADSVLFVLCCFLSFWSFKTSRERLRRALRLIIDGLFMLALSIMVVVCAITTPSRSQSKLWAICISILPIAIRGFLSTRQRR